jgi:hypothetical protein
MLPTGTSAAARPNALPAAPLCLSPAAARSVLPPQGCEEDRKAASAPPALDLLLTRNVQPTFNSSTPKNASSQLKLR